MPDTGTELGRWLTTLTCRWGQVCHCSARPGALPRECPRGQVLNLYLPVQLGVQFLSSGVFLRARVASWGLNSQSSSLQSCSLKWNLAVLPGGPSGSQLPPKVPAPEYIPCCQATGHTSWDREVPQRSSTCSSGQWWQLELSLQRYAVATQVAVVL